MSEEIYKTVVEKVLQHTCQEKPSKYYFLIKQSQQNTKDFSLAKITFREEPLLNLEDNLKEDETFALVFNNSEISHKKLKKKTKEEYLLGKLKSSNDSVSDEQIVEKLEKLLKCEKKNKENIFKKNSLHELHNSYAFYDDAFCENFYLMGDEYDLQISKQLNGLSVLSLNKCSTIFFNILSDLKADTSKSFIQLIKENVKVEYDPRLLNARVSGKRKKNALFVNENMTILKIFYKDKLYMVKNKICGYQLDINENLVENPYLLFLGQQEAWILILKCKEDVISQKCITAIQYEEKRKSVIEQYNCVLDSLRK
ncbi:conserved Plasmodium protein, unknown function [Plasmodium knowlesi strain H]|uniref:Uncharacterized protein n=3 Tax=Plasmodium knowlesi TaxID=5850 RepID=A0A5K1UE88_PLAKH|nr:conserved Plasmodium protein, unknown function [Plasmodium knowlesi strain H]OTN64039.1 Uncharacterized protein PKNOH_S140220600 [Plasmodium knowlesi]CAA9990634.1 conserved Plasmodium protein, unknown function [Plasmodium knowlesi strain H]SBO26018.1 conserved Plasmodium protein, unknown function [Plasmodium knowlesi strain H]SBO28724.1 conserved Plasmodium protein, unknown function [Plasmodium knowlesi strain H]VVS80108.1 conserved Plasmodium protein, unknown function [Plasmodium knowlesi |eukprot:XP_002261925.1 hypothetical protein, conserved in Plasmodium species [Plasmodium knowlesi strain H]